ncbi:MAG: HAD family hydrolase [Candidatus Moranbacteria bacterium]|nr:HAD family hydrolase [Candidatus Moranbacteria bacterium]
MKLVLFDIDKTLVKSSAGHRAAFSAAFKEIYGIDASIDIIQPSGMTDQQIIFEVLKIKGLDEEKIKSKLDLCMEKMADVFSGMIATAELTILPGVKELLEELKNNGVLIGLVTGNLEPIAQSKMKKLNLDRYFKVGGFGNDHIDRTELVKIAIKKARSKFDFIFSNNVYLFGDAPQDMKAGNEAGIIPIGVTTGIYSKQQLENAGASLVLNDLTDTEEILRYVLN